MVTFDEYIPVILGIVGTLIISVSILLLGNHLKIWRRTQETSTVATFNIGSMQEDFKRMEKTQDDIKLHLDRKLDGLMTLIEKKEETAARKFDQLVQQNISLDRKMVVMEFRLNELESDRSSGGRRGRDSG